MILARLTLLSWALVGIFAQATGASPGEGIDLLQLLNYGVLGLVLVMAISGKGLVPSWVLTDERKAHDATRAERDAEKVENQRLNTLIQDKYVPALEASRTTGEAMFDWVKAQIARGRGVDGN